MEHLRGKARQLGANAIIIDKNQPVKSGIIPTGILVEARAIRIDSNTKNIDKTMSSCNEKYKKRYTER